MIECVFGAAGRHAGGYDEPDWAGGRGVETGGGSCRSCCCCCC
mgnify:CR=1 FL=1